MGRVIKRKIINAIIEVILDPIKAVPHAFLEAIKFPEKIFIEKKDKRELNTVAYVTLSFQAEIYIEYNFEYNKFDTLQSFSDSIWFYLNKFIKVEAYTYGKIWKVRNCITGKWIST